jgi:hypothetical protein
MRTTEFAPAHEEVPEVSASAATPQPAPAYGPPQVVQHSRMGCLPGSDFHPQADGTLRCPEDHPLYPKARRLERDGTLRVVYAARIGHCRLCPLRQPCQGYGASTKHPRRVSAILHPLPDVPRAPVARRGQSGHQASPVGRLEPSLSSASLFHSHAPSTDADLHD